MHHAALSPSLGWILGVVPFFGILVTLALVGNAFVPLLPASVVGPSLANWIAGGTVGAHAIEGIVSYRAASHMRLSRVTCMGWALLTVFTGFDTPKRLRQLAFAKAAEEKSD